MLRMPCLMISATQLFQGEVCEDVRSAAPMPACACPA